MDSEDKLIIKEINRLTKESSYFKKLSKIKYHNVKGYCTFKETMFDIARLLTSYNLYPVGFFKEHFTHRNSLINLQELYTKGFTPIWLSPNLLNAFINSKVPEHITSFKRSVINGILFLPNTLKTPDNVPVKWLTFTHRRKNDPPLSFKVGGYVLDFAVKEEESIVWTTVLDNGVQYSVNREIKIIDNKLISNPPDLFINDVSTDKSNTLPETEKEFIETLSSIVLQTLIYLQLESSKESASSLSFQSSLHSSSRSTVLSPFILGKDYVIKKHSTYVPKGGTHRSPITHWRMGHYRVQPYGSKENPSYRTIWIEPMIINAHIDIN